MNGHEMEKLLGGYATGTLTDREREALFAAALENQALFDALADEETLRELLADPQVRRHLLAALEAPESALPFWRRRPLVWTLAGSLAGFALLIGVVRFTGRESARQELAMATEGAGPPPPFLQEPPSLTQEPSVIPGPPPPPPPAAPQPPVAREEKSLDLATPVLPPEAVGKTMPPPPPPSAPQPAGRPAPGAGDTVLSLRSAIRTPFLRYRVERRTASGEYEAAPAPGRPIAPGESIRITVESAPESRVALTIPVSPDRQEVHEGRGSLTYTFVVTEAAIERGVEARLLGEAPLLERIDLR